MRKKTFYLDDEINLIEIIKELWKKKYSVFLISLLFVILSIWVELAIPKKFKTSAILGKPDIIEIKKINEQYPFIGVTNEELDSLIKFQSDFFSQFIIEVTSITNFKNFIENQDDIKPFLIFLQRKNTSLSQYLLDNFKEKQQDPKKSQNNLPEIEFFYPNELKGFDLINSYILHIAHVQKIELINNIVLILNEKLNNIVLQKSLYIKKRKGELEINILQHEIKLQEYVNSQTRSLNNELFKYTKALNTAKSINLEEPIPTSILKGNSGSILNEPGALFYKGAKVLNSEIQNIKSYLNNIDKTETYNEILSEIEINKNQLVNLDKTIEFNQILDKERATREKINLIEEINLNWNPINKNATQPDKHFYPISKLYFMIMGLFLGFFISVIFVLLKQNQKKK